MKKVIVLSALFFSLVTFAQVPQGITYQAVAINASGAAVINSNVNLRLSVLDNSASGTVLYSETQSKTTNAQGLFNLVIGQGTVVAGTFSAINWRTNSKFLKVEMDVNGGSNYVLTGTTQLLSVPYALAADSLVTSPGEGITLISPNGTPYTITVNDSGQLSLPTSGATTTVPDNFYMYGSFNSYNPATSLLTATTPGFGGLYKYGYKYLTAGSEVKFVTANNASGAVYGVNGTGMVALNASAYTVPSTAFYYFLISIGTADPSNPTMSFTTNSISPQVFVYDTGQGVNAILSNPTYNAGTNTFSFIANGITTSNNEFTFSFTNPMIGTNIFGDNLADGQIDPDGSAIVFPNTTGTPKNYRIDFVLNFNGSGSYTITQI